MRQRSKKNFLHLTYLFITLNAQILVGPQHREVVTKFGSVMQPREMPFDRKTMRQSNAITNYREVMGKGVFVSAAADNLQRSTLVPTEGPGRARPLGGGLNTAREPVDNGSSPSTRRSQPVPAAAAYSGPRMHHPPPARAPEAPMRDNFVPTSLPAPYAWTPTNPGSVTYGFHRRW